LFKKRKTFSTKTKLLLHTHPAGPLNINFTATVIGQVTLPMSVKISAFRDSRQPGLTAPERRHLSLCLQSSPYPGSSQTEPLSSGYNFPSTKGTNHKETAC